MMQSKQGEESNKDRKSRGIPTLQVIGWAEVPKYDANAHRLVWAISAKEEGSPDASDRVVNYNTYALGRDGFFSVNLVTSEGELSKHKLAAQTLLSSLNYNDGKRYADFQPGTDKVAEYGIAALVAGVAAKKLGLLALIGAFLAKSFKAIALIVVGGFVAVKKFFGRKSRQDV